MKFEEDLVAAIQAFTENPRAVDAFKAVVINRCWALKNAGDANPSASILTTIREVNQTKGHSDERMEHFAVEACLLVMK